MQDNKKFVDVNKQEYGSDFDKMTGCYEEYIISNQEEETTI